MIDIGRRQRETIEVLLPGAGTDSTGNMLVRPYDLQLYIKGSVGYESAELEAIVYGPTNARVRVIRMAGSTEDASVEGQAGSVPFGMFISTAAPETLRLVNETQGVEVLITLSFLLTLKERF